MNPIINLGLWDYEADHLQHISILVAKKKWGTIPDVIFNLMKLKLIQRWSANGYTRDCWNIYVQESQFLFFKARSLNIHGLQQVFHGFPVIFSLLRERGLMICPLVTTIPPQSNQGKWPGRKWLASIASCVFPKSRGYPLVN